MSTDPPTQEVKLLRHWITDLEVSAGRADPDSRFSARIYVDEELVCDLPWIDSAQSLQWSGLLCCDMSPTSEVAVRLCKSVKDKPRYFNYPPYTVSDVDEETGESALELRTAAWIITVRSLTPTMAEQTYPNELEKFDAIEGTYDKLEPDATIKYLFKYSLRFASIIAEARPESTAKVSFLVYMKAWELLDQQTQFDDTVQAILRGLIWVGNIVDIINQASRSILADCIEQAKEPIKGILALLEDVSAYIFHRYTTGDLVRIPAEHEENQNGYDVETYSKRLEELQRSFFASWSPATTSGTNNIWTADDDEPYESQQNNRGIADEPVKITDPYTILSLLRPTDPSSYDPRQACMRGTREVIINKVLTWSQNRDSSEGLMWISGQIGMGKTAIATSLCQRLNAVRALAGSFFFRHDDPGMNDPLRIINHLVHDIAHRCPAYAEQVARAILADRMLCHSHFDLQYEHLIKQPLMKLRSLSSPKSLVVVIDGLDQCRDYEFREWALTKLNEMSQLVPWLKIVITARPVGDIQEFFDSNCRRASISHIQDYDCTSDIRAYIEAQVGSIAQKDRWPEDSIDKLCTMAEGVFLWAALAVKYIKCSILPSLPRLMKAINSQKSPVTDQLDLLYTDALRIAVGDDDDRDVENAFSRCIGAILATSERQPLSVSDLEYLLLVAGQIDQPTLAQVVKSLGPFLVVTDGQRIRFHHSSFKAFITSSSRSGHFCVQVNEYEAEPAACCLLVMQRELRFNICELETSHLANSEVRDLKSRVELHIGPALKYACTHWIVHFVASPNQALVDAVKKLMEGPQLLYWIETLSLLGRIDDAIAGLSKLTSLKLTQLNGWDQITPWIDDARHFLLSFYDVISSSAPHLYISALAFAPRASPTAQRMRPFFPNTVSVAQGADEHWHPCIQTVHHQQPVNTLSISSDGTRILVGYPGGSLCMRDTQTGSLIGSPLVGHTGPVSSVAFSPSAKLAVSGSLDKTVRVWGLRSTGAITCHTLTGHFGPVNSVTFSPVSTLVASGSSDNTIRLWDTESMRAIGGPYNGHSSSVSSIVFSPCGTKLVSGSWDKTIRVWSVDIGGQQLGSGPLVITGHSDSVTCVDISHNGSTIASGSMDKTLRLWTASTGKAIESRASQAKHPSSITCVSFSRCGRLIISSSADGIIQIHDVATMSAIVRPFHHASCVNSVNVLPDGLHVMSGSTDLTSRVWQISALPKAMAMTPFVGHSSGINSISLSKDGSRLISGSHDGTLRIWDAQTGSQIGSPFPGHSPRAGFAISPDATRVVSCSSPSSLNLWDITTHVVIHSYQLTYDIHRLALSPDGALVAFGTSGHAIYLWEVAGRKIAGTVTRARCWVAMSIAFSPDGVTLAYASHHTIVLWNVAAYSQLGDPLSGHTDWVHSLAFSPCGTWLASGSDDMTVRVWEVKTGNVIRELKGHSGFVKSVAFSPNGTYIASGSLDRTVRLWNASTGQLIDQPFTEHSPVLTIAFSPDGRYLISGSEDSTIRVRELDASYVATEQPTNAPGASCWPSNPYNLSSHPHRPGWVTHDQHSLAFWLPPHYHQPAQFLSPQTQESYPQTFLDYSKFVHGAAWTNVASECIRRRRA